MPPFTHVGDIPRKRFSQFRDENDKLYATEVFGEEGFSSNFSLLMHRHCPSALTAIEAVTTSDGAADDDFHANHPLSPRLWLTDGFASSGDLVSHRTAFVRNEDVVISFAAATEPSPLFRNAVADELHYVHRGSARFESVCGALEVGPGDYVVIPKSLTHRWVPGDEGVRTLVIETRGHVRTPERYLSSEGQFLQNAPYSELDLRRPTEPLLADGHDVEVVVKSAGGWARHVHVDHPFDVVGWFGCNYPYALNVADFSPITGSFHRPPPVHQVFAAPNLVICNFVPRLLDYDPRAMPIPSFHSNVDSDEIIFYAEGEFFSRRGSGISAGAMSLHPAGHLHGPHPVSYEKAAGLVGGRTEEIAVMIDTFRPLELAAAAASHERTDYAMSWSRKPPPPPAAAGADAAPSSAPR